MATLAGVTIADNSSTFDSGVALLLQQEIQIDEVVPVGSDWEVEVRSGSPYVVARGGGKSTGTSSVEIFANAYEATQSGLDLLSVTGKADLSIRDAMNESVVWWHEGGKQVLKVITTARMGFSLSAELEVRDASGNIKRQPPVPTPKYHECLRYFRLAQVTDDLFDAYRNLWLSFELLLSSQYPKQGRERDWLEDALTKVHNSLNLTNGYQPSGQDVVAEIIDDLYTNARLPLFHATANRAVFVPQNLSDRETVGEALKKLTRLLLFLIENWLHASRPSGGISYYGFDTAIKDVLGDSEILVSDGDAPLDPAHETPADAGFDPAVALSTRYAPEFSTPGRQFWLGKASSADLRGLAKVMRFGMAAGNKMILYHVMEAELTHESIDGLQAQIGSYMINTRQPKYLFPA